MEFKVLGKRDSGKLWLHCVAHPMVLFVKRGVAKPAQSVISSQTLSPICLGNNSAWGGRDFYHVSNGVEHELLWKLGSISGKIYNGDLPEGIFKR
ncbi:hypothetical protein CEXT_40231 [Caerostris extrusa]|uniref:Uncharacterized protein n=1 Tax=Caerostris extrusa TaxID=172846 RepID=A0AAV4UP13_CAEEX|nr:hypothetical protein CEXT_40231 [Caerostris extrusa]